MRESCLKAQKFSVHGMSLRNCQARLIEKPRLYVGLISNINMLQDKRVKWFSDNKNVKSVLKSGSSKPDLQEIALDINQTGDKRGITLFPEWICRSENEAADGLSRGLDSDDWQIQGWVFREIDSAWGKHTVDRFASNLNYHCERFNSRFWCPGTEGLMHLINVGPWTVIGLSQRLGTC